MKFKQKVLTAGLVLSVIAPAGFFAPRAQAQLSVVRPIVFPVIGPVSYFDDFGNARSGGRTHEGNDLIGKKLLPLIAVADGTISFVNYPEPSWGFAVGIRDKDDYSYWYLHINNDNPGTDDGKGDGFFAYAPDVQSGNRVVKGQLIGWMGDSGNAEGTSPHLHFEIHQPNGDPFSPYQSLKAAGHAPAPTTVYPALPKEILPYGDFKGGMSVAAGNFDKDKPIELVTGAGPGGGPLIHVLEKDGKVKTSFYPYDQNFRGGIDVAAGDIDDDGITEIITAPGAGGGPHVKVFKANGTLVKEFMAYDPSFHGGVNVAAADLDGDDKAEIITGPGAGGGPNVRVFKASDGTVIEDFMAYDPNFHGGIDVAGVAAATSSSRRSSSRTPAAIITAPQAGGGPQVKIFNADGSLEEDFLAYDSSFQGGVRLSIQVSGSGSRQTRRVVTMPASGGGPNLKTFDMRDGDELSSTTAGFEVWWRGGYDVAAASDGSIFIASGPGGRRASLRPSDFNRRSSDRRSRVPRGD